MTPSKRSIERRLASFEAEADERESPRELGWFDLLEHAKHYGAREALQSGRKSGEASPLD